MLLVVCLLSSMIVFGVLVVCCSLCGVCGLLYVGCYSLCLLVGCCCAFVLVVCFTMFVVC